MAEAIRNHQYDQLGGMHIVSHAREFWPGVQRYETKPAALRKAPGMAGRFVPKAINAWSALFYVFFACIVSEAKVLNRLRQGG